MSPRGRSRCAPEFPGMRHRFASIAGVLLALIIGFGAADGNAQASNYNSTIAWMMNGLETVSIEHERVTYESGEESPYFQAPNDARLQPTTDVARAGNRAGAVLLLPDDPQYRDELGYRSEWQSGIYADDGHEYSYGASYYLPSDWNQGSNSDTFDDRIIYQFHEGNGSPTFSLHLHEDGEFWVRHRDEDGDFTKLWSQSFDTNTWYDFAFRVRWSSSDDGFFQIYLNGRLVRQYSGQTLNHSSRIYTKWGIYGQPTKLVVDEVAIIEGANGLFDATPAEVSTLMDAVPSSGVALVRFSGGSTENLVASSGCEDTATFWFTLGGELIFYTHAAPAFVNARWNDTFGDTLPRNTLLIASCGGA